MFHWRLRDPGTFSSAQGPTFCPCLLHSAARRGHIDRTIAEEMEQIALALLMIALAALGLTITFTSLRKDLKQRRRGVYRPRGPC